MTAGAAAAHPGVERMTIVEIEAQVLGRPGLSTHTITESWTTRRSRSS